MQDWSMNISVIECEKFIDMVSYSMNNQPLRNYISY